MFGLGSIGVIKSIGGSLFGGQSDEDKAAMQEQAKEWEGAQDARWKKQGFQPGSPLYDEARAAWRTFSDGDRIFNSGDQDRGRPLWYKSERMWAEVHRKAAEMRRAGLIDPLTGKHLNPVAGKIAKATGLGPKDSKNLMMVLAAAGGVLLGRRRGWF